MSTRRVRVPTTGKPRMKADGKAAREARSPANAKAVEGKPHATGRSALVDGKPHTNGKPAIVDGKPLDGDIAPVARPTAANGNGADRPPPSPWRASRERQHDREVKREAVIRAAAHAFNLKGYHNTSLDDIAAALEVTKPTGYYYV